MCGRAGPVAHTGAHTRGADNKLAGRVRITCGPAFVTGEKSKRRKVENCQFKWVKASDYGKVGQGQAS